MGKHHTPAPWEVVALNGFGPFAIRMPTPAGTTQPTHYGIGQIGTRENAVLVAAAPDMFDALMLIADQDISKELADIARAAIAKATP